MTMRRRFVHQMMVALLATMLLTGSAFAGNNVSDAPKSSSEAQDLPLHLQLLSYVSTLLTAGEEVPKALLNKILAFSKGGN